LMSLTIGRTSPCCNLADRFCALAAPFVALAWLSPAFAHPDPHALLRGVEASRSGVVSGQFEYRLQVHGTRPGLREPIERYLKMEFDGNKVKCEQRSRELVISPPDEQAKKQRLRAMNYDRGAFVRAGLGQWEDIVIKKVFDGSQVLGASGQKSAGISAPPNPRSEGTAGLLFDPRTMGLSFHSHFWETIEYCLGYREASSVVCRGQEKVGGQLAWHVIVSKARGPGQDPVERHFWIGDQEGFPVYRCELQTKDTLRELIESDYENPVATHVLPVRVRINGKFDAKGKPTVDMVFEQVKGAYGVAIDPATFTLKGLDLELGASVTDNRLQQVVGYWNGTDLSPDPSEAIRSGKRAQSGAIGPWPWALGALIVLLAGGIAAFLARRKFQRQGAA
jgi:hypothetical protein